MTDSSKVGTTDAEMLGTELGEHDGIIVGVKDGTTDAEMLGTELGETV